MKLTDLRTAPQHQVSVAFSLFFFFFADSHYKKILLFSPLSQLSTDVCKVQQQVSPAMSHVFLNCPLKFPNRLSNKTHQSSYIWYSWNSTRAPRGMFLKHFLILFFTSRMSSAVLIGGTSAWGWLLPVKSEFFYLIFPNIIFTKSIIALVARLADSQVINSLTDPSAPPLVSFLFGQVSVAALSKTSFLPFLFKLVRNWQDWK